VRKTLKLYYPLMRVEGLYCLEPSIAGKVLRMGDFQCFGDRHIVEVLSELVEKLLREGELSYYVGKDGIPPFEEYLAFLTEEEARYFLDFPRRWKEGEVCPLLLGTSGQFAH